MPSPQLNPVENTAPTVVQDPPDSPAAASVSSTASSAASGEGTAKAPNPSATPLSPASTSAGDPDESPDPDTTLVIGNGTVVVGLSADAKKDFPELAIELKREKKTVVRREGWKEITQFDLKKLHPCDTWSTRMSQELLGKVNVVRLSLICRVGEDYLTSTEIAVLLDPDTLKTVWSGAADEWINSMDSCIFSRRVTFQSKKAKTIEKTILESTIWSEQLIEEGAKARLKKECKVGSKRRVEQVAIP